MAKPYIVTCDLQKRFSQLGHLGLKMPDLEKFFGEFDETLVNLIKKAFPDDDVVVFGVDELANEILTVATQKQKEFKGHIVSTSVDFSNPRRGTVLEVNRIINEEGKIIGIGPRPGHPYFGKQFSDIASIAQGGPIIIVEDGIFSGSTLIYIIGKLKERRVNIASVVVGFGLSSGIQKLKEVYDGEVVTIHELEDFIDWMPDHDFFPFAPNCGRVLGVKVNGNYLPLYNHNGLSYTIPYILPFGPMEDWTSIPGDFNYPISYFAMDKAVEFYDRLDKLNNKRVKIKDVMDINPRISASISVNPNFFPTINEEIGRFLHSVHAESW